MSASHTALLFLRSFGSFLALGTALAALVMQARLLESMPDVSLSPWELGSAPLVVVDAGHGGHDGGAVAHGVIEKHLSLALAKQVKAHLEEAGLNVRMTREKDRFLELEARCEVAAKARADAFVSIHLNTNPATEVHGIETYYAADSIMARSTNKRGPAGESLARLIQRHASLGTQAEDRGIKDSRLVVVMQTPCPAALVECGFLTHGEEVRQLQKKEYQEKLTRGIAGGVIEFLKGRAQPRREAVAKVTPP
jgi:N-acetylmuramoyl-L-alanine amidase